MRHVLAFALLLSSYSFGQPIAELFYMDYIDSLVANDLASVREYEGRTERYHTLKGFYYNDELVAVQTVQKGELANFKRSTYYMKNGALYASSEHSCRTNEFEILDLALYAEAHRDSLGKVDYSKLPMNCMTVKLFCQSGKMTREIEGMDVFDPLEPFSEKQQADHQQCTHLLTELDRYSKL